MPQKRKWTESDLAEQANKSDSEDEDYDEKEARPTPKRKSKGRHHQQSSHKKRRRVNSDDDDLTDDSLMEESFVEDSVEEEEPEIDSRTGRPKRSAKKQVNYDISSESDGTPAPSDEDEDEQKPTEAKSMRPKLLVKLKMPRNWRGSRAASAAVSITGTRRSTRNRSEQPAEDLVALTDSGRHAQVVRPPTHSPESGSRRPMTGRKGLKAPATSMVEEEVDEDSFDTRVIAESEQDEGSIEADETANVLESDTHLAIAGDNEALGVVDVNMDAVEQAEEEIVAVNVDNDDDEDEEEPITRGRSTRAARATTQSDPSRASKQRRKRAADESSDFEPPGEDVGEEDLSESDADAGSPSKKAAANDDDDDSISGRRAARSARGKGRGNSSRRLSGSDNEDEAEELAEELEELGNKKKRRNVALYDDQPRTHNRRERKQVDYRLYKGPEFLAVEEEERVPAASPSRRGRGGGGWERNIFPVNGPFGGAGGMGPMFGGPGAIGAAGGVDSDSSDDERAPRPPGLAVGMTPTAGNAPGLFPAAQAHNANALQVGDVAGTPANLGRIKDRQALADADPLGVDPNVNFDSVGGLQGHIDQLKEMVSLPLLYPEIFTRFHVTPPRGVLFHGPPGTGKTLLARALAASVSSQGRKVTFYMRKGADALSKWVGEAERQLRLLFEEARKTQPSIIFFDEIDGLAPVRSSKQEQIHASIVSTLLALMDGMDGRGQVIVIGATNRPDSVDPALRRPGRFDREFYFPLPNTEARRAILDIHTKGWQPGLSDEFKNQIAGLTKGYGGADLRALCTEAALNAVQRTYPQIYASKEKLIIDPSTIDVTAKDFMISVKMIVPSSERSASSGSAPLPKIIEPLLRKQFAEIKGMISAMMPQKKKQTALEEAQFEEPNDVDGGFQRERLQQEFETSRIFRPRLLIRGRSGMGHNYVAAGLLNHFEGLHVQVFDLPTLLGDSTRSAAATIVQLFAEARRHRPSVIFLPDASSWADTLEPNVSKTFLSLLRKIPPTEQVLLLGLSEQEHGYLEEEDPYMESIFGRSKKNRYTLVRPDEPARIAFFHDLIMYIKKRPTEFPDSENRKKRKFAVLPVAPPPPPRIPTKEELKAQKAKDHQSLNQLKIRIQPIMDQIKSRYRRFRTPPIDKSKLQYLFDEIDANIAPSDIREGYRPYEITHDKEGNQAFWDVYNRLLWYNMDIVTIEERLVNGYYCRPKDFVKDIRFISADSKHMRDRDRDRYIKASELIANVEIDVAGILLEPLYASIDWEGVYAREMKRRTDKDEKAKKAATANAIQVANALNEVREVTSQPGTIDEPRREPTQMARPTHIPELAPPSTPSRPSQTSSLSNGVTSSMVPEPGNYSMLSNGSSRPSHNADGDVQMGDAPHQPRPQDKSQHDGSQRHFSPPSQNLWGAPPAQPSQASTATGQRSAANTQRGAMTPMPPGSQVEDFINDASTTTSGKKTTESNQSSGPWTQSSNGVRKEGDEQATPVENIPAASQAADAPDVPLSQGSGPHSQPGQGAYAISSLLNTTTTPTAPATTAAPGSVPSASPPDEYVTNDGVEDDFHKDIVKRTSGLSIEQLEHVHAAMMDAVWRTRGEWNRVKVQATIVQIFNEVIADLGESEDIEESSAPDGRKRGRNGEPRYS